MIVTYLLVCLASCHVTGGDGTSATVGAGYVGDRILWDGQAPYTPPDGWEIKADDGTAIGGTTAP
jgi:hypothetical protein